MESRKLISMPICNKEMETQMERKDLWTQWGRERVRQMEKVAPKYRHYYVSDGWLVRSGCIAQGAQSGSVMTWRGGVGGGEEDLGGRRYVCNCG